MCCKKMNQKVFFVLFFITIILGISGCHVIDPDWDHGRHKASESFRYELDIDDQTGFNLLAINGTIDISGTSQNDYVIVWGERIVTADERWEAEDYLDRLQIRIIKSDNEIYVKTEQPSNVNNVNLEVNYHVQIPNSWSAEVTHVNGDVMIDSLNSYVAVCLTNGEVWIYDVTGSVWTYLTNGDVDVSMELPDNGICDVGVTNGKIRLNIPKNTSAGFLAQVTNGDIDIYNLELQDIQSSPNYLSGILGSGKGTIRLGVTNGDIQARGRD